jgi:hypothetical protein
VKYVKRLTVNLSAPATQGLNDAMKAAGENQTDVVNKALQVYADLRRAQENGGGAWIQESPDAELTSIRCY